MATAAVRNVFLGVGGTPAASGILLGRHSVEGVLDRRTFFVCSGEALSGGGGGAGDGRNFESVDSFGACVLFVSP